MRQWPTAIAVFFFVAVSSAQAPPPGASPRLHLRVATVEGAQAVLADTESGERQTVRVGEQIQGWTVRSITPAGVELERENEAGEHLRVQLPAALRLVPTTP
jgi:hypothetical protein